MAVWFGLQNLNKLVLGDRTRQSFMVRVLKFRDFFSWQFGGLVWSAKNLNKLALGDMARHNFQVRGLIFRDFLAFGGLVWSGKL
jgi:hypothetical protein